MATQPKSISAVSTNLKKNELNEQRFIVDRDITDNAIEGIFVTI